MQKIIYWNEGIEIHFNDNQYIKEILFELDDNNEICNTLKIFPVQFNLNKEQYDIQIAKIKNFVNIEKGFLFYSFIFQKAYGHFIGQTLPKLLDYLEICKNTEENIPLIIPKVFYNVITKNILELLKIENIIILEDKTIYNINKLITIPHYSTVPDIATNRHIEIYNLIRTKIKITNTNEKKRKVYLKRDGFKSIEYGNDETGIYREIKNEDELIEKLSSLGFEIITLGR